VNGTGRSGAKGKHRRVHLDRLVLKDSLDGGNEHWRGMAFVLEEMLSGRKVFTSFGKESGQ
jgi:hypothetical protein